MRNAYEVLKERGFIEQLTHEDEIKELFAKGGVTFYIGIDPTADSLHVGHFLTVMAMAHMQQCGNRPICLMGGGHTDFEAVCCQHTVYRKVDADFAQELNVVQIAQPVRAAKSTTRKKCWRLS